MNKFLSINTKRDEKVHKTVGLIRVKITILFIEIRSV